MIGIDSLLKIKDFLPYATKQKIKNLITSQCEYLMKKIRLVSLPYSYFIDPGNICNLKCVLCPTANKKNERFVSSAKNMAKSIGVKITFPKFQISQEIVKIDDVINRSLVNEWVPDILAKNPMNYLFTIKPLCYFLYKIMVINPDGTVMPCCAVYDPKYNFGNILRDSLEEVWNNSYFLSARSIFLINIWTIKKLQYVIYMRLLGV